MLSAADFSDCETHGRRRILSFAPPRLRSELYHDQLGDTGPPLKRPRTAVDDDEGRSRAIIHANTNYDRSEPPQVHLAHSRLLHASTSGSPSRSASTYSHAEQHNTGASHEMERRRILVAHANPYPYPSAFGDAHAEKRGCSDNQLEYTERQENPDIQAVYSEPQGGYSERPNPEQSAYLSQRDRERHTHPERQQSERKATERRASISNNTSNKPPARDGATTAAGTKKENRAQKTLSCMECRRLKLKCDRKFPCQSCCKRGCAEICPSGALTSGRGSRFILANTEQLHAKITQLAERVRQLEDALEELHTQLYLQQHPDLLNRERPDSQPLEQTNANSASLSYSPTHGTPPPQDSTDLSQPSCPSTTLARPDIPPHPLLVSNLLLIKASLEVSAQADDGGCKNGADGGGGGTARARPRNIRADTGDLKAEEVYMPSGQHINGHRRNELETALSGAPHEYEMRRMDAGSGYSQLDGPSLQSAVTSIERSRSRPRTPDVPPDLVRLSASFPYPWRCDLQTRKRIRDRLPTYADAQALCDDARRNALWQFNLDASQTFIDNLLHHVYATPIEDVSPRRLGLLLMNLAVGAAVGGSGEQSPSDREAAARAGQAYLHLARASLTEIGLMEAPDFDLLHCLFYMVWYHLTFSDDRKAVTYAWNMTGFVAKLAQGLGLHRDTSKIKVIPEEDERRRAIFWEIVNLDYRLSLSLGRPPSLCLVHIDAKPPRYDESSLMCYHDWKTRFLATCLHPVLQATVTVDPPPYSRVVELDALIREFGFPDVLQHSQRTEPFPAMQSAAARLGTDVVLLQLHRRHFLKAMNTPDEFDLDHELAPSVVATYICSSSLITATAALYDAEPNLSTRFIHFWFNLFGAATALRLLVIRIPTSPISGFAVRELRRIRNVFRTVAQRLPFCAKAMPILETWVDKARRMHAAAQADAKAVDRASLPPLGALPLPFENVHPALEKGVQRILASIPRPPSREPSEETPTARSKSRRAEIERLVECIPDVYSFSYLDPGSRASSSFSDADEAEHKPRVSSDTPMAAPSDPFMPSEPRIGGNQAMHLDSGAFIPEVTETCYMAWF